MKRPVHSRLSGSCSCTLFLLATFSLLTLADVTPPLSAQNRTESVGTVRFGGVTLLRSDQFGLDIVVEPRIAFEVLPDGLILPRVEGGGTLLGEPGGPMEQELTVPVGLPQPEGTRITILSVDYGEPIAGEIAPLPTFRQESDGIWIESRSVDRQLYSQWHHERPVATFRYGGIARGLHIGQIVLEPYRYDPAVRQIVPLRRLHLRLDYGGSGEGGGDRRSGSLQRLDPGIAAALINPERAVNWTTQGVRTERSPQLPFSRPASAERISSARYWFRVEVEREGFVEITAEDFEGLGINSSSISSIAVYGGRGIPLPESIDSAPANRMNALPIITERNGGRVSRILFYATGTVGWGFEKMKPGDTIPRRINNPYILRNSYVIAIDGDTSPEFSLQSDQGGRDVTVDYGMVHLLAEQDLINTIAQGNNGVGGGRDWFGPSFIVDEFRSEQKRLFTDELPDLYRSMPIAYRLRMANRGTINGRAWLEQNGAMIGSAMSVIRYGGEQATAGASEMVVLDDAARIGADNRSQLGITYRNDSSSTGYLDWYEIHYARQLRARENRIQFESPTGTGVAEYRISGFETNRLIGLDVTDPVHPVRLQPSVSEGGLFVFRDRLPSSPRARRRYYIGSPDNPAPVVNPSLIPFGNLRSTARNGEYLVITSPRLLEGARSYADYRRKQGRSVEIVTTDEIYTEFSNGQLDPTAIRDFVSYAYHNWTSPPRYLLLIGDGHYDYRHLQFPDEQDVPIYTMGDTTHYSDIEISVYDDYYVRVEGNDPLIDLVPGRIPVSNLKDLSVIIEKIRQYESPRSWGEWRKRMLLVSDDRAPLRAGGTFVPQCEWIEQHYIPDWIQTEKIYLPEYPTVNGGDVKKPQATQDLLQWINRGLLFVNWVGHGNARVWAHENLLQKDLFIPQLTNDSALAVVMAATCNFGRIDDPQVYSGGEMFLARKGGGAALVLATSRAVYIDQSEALMYAFFSHLFDRDPSTRQILPIGDGLMAAKLQSNEFKNSQKYIILGDPSMRINFPVDSVAIEQVRNVDVTTDTARISALSMVRVEGSIRDRQGNLQEGFNGKGIVSLYDADEHKTLNDEGMELGMVDLGGLLFRGPIAVEKGRFSGEFRVPRDIVYDSSSNGRLYVYAWNSEGDAAGATRNVIIYGSDTAEITDVSGPTVTIYVDDRSFRSGDVVTPTPNLIVDLDDPSGINATGAGLGHHIEAWIGNALAPVDLTEFYTTSPDDFRSGTAEREILGLDPGEYRVRVRAWDIFNNPSESVVWFRVAEGDGADLQIADVTNYPNPMGKETEILFRHNQTRPLDATVDIYTPAGRRIRRLVRTGITDRFVRISWDGRDSDGERVANGIYFYRLHVSVDDGENGGEGVREVEVLEKIAVAQ